MWNPGSLDRAGREFLAEMTKRGVRARLFPDGDRAEIVTIDGTVVVALDNLARCLDNGDVDAVQRFASSALAAPRPVPSWDQARRGVYLIAETADMHVADTIWQTATRQLVRVLAYVDDDSVRLLSEAQLSAWGVGHDAVLEVAAENLADQLERADVTFDSANGVSIAMVEPRRSVIKASLIFSPNLRERVGEQLGWPIRAIAPARDFLYLFSRTGSDAILEGIGRVVIREFSSSAYPVSPELLEVGDEGVTAIGSFG